MEDAFSVEAAVVEMSAADGEVGQRGQAEVKEARELVAKARHFETQRRRLAGAAGPRGGAGRVVIDVAAVRSCVEINRCVGCTKSFLGDDAAPLT